MIAISLQSGSNGNCFYVETGGVRLLFDAGICGADAQRRLAEHGRDIRQVDAVLISHDHADHVRSVGVFQRKYGLPVHITQKTLDVAVARHRLGKFNNINIFMSGGTLQFGSVFVRTIPTPHDGRDGSAFVVHSNNKRLGILTDLGHVFEGLAQEIAALDAVFIESNYDPAMLRGGPYPAFLKRRIEGPGGHISNFEAAELLMCGRKLKWACLAHLSEQNNNPYLAVSTHRKLLGEGLPIYTAGRYSATGVLKI